MSTEKEVAELVTLVVAAEAGAGENAPWQPPKAEAVSDPQPQGLLRAHLDDQALPREQGGSVRGWLLPASTLSLGLLCCFCVKVNQSLLLSCCVCFPLCLIFPPALAPPSPQRIEMSAQNLCESSMYLSLPSVSSAWADQLTTSGLD
jgi:hypothetical protein